MGVNMSVATLFSEGNMSVLVNGINQLAEECATQVKAASPVDPRVSLHNVLIEFTKICKTLADHASEGLNVKLSAGKAANPTLFKASDPVETCVSSGPGIGA